MISLSNEKNVNELEVVRRSIPFSQSFQVEGDTINKAFEDYKTAIAKTVETNLSLLEELPPLKNLQIEDLKQHLKKMVETDLKEDDAFEKSVEINRYVGNMWKYVDSYFREIFKFHDEVKEDLDSQIFDVSRMYFNSDLPLLFLTTIEDAILIEKDYLDTYDKRIHKEHAQLLFNRNNRKKFEQLCDNHNRWIKPFSERVEKLERTRIKFFWYVDFSNSATVDEIFKVKTIRFSALDTKTFRAFIDDLRKQIHEMEMLIGPERQFSLFTSYEENGGAASIRKIMELIDSPEG
jgi:bacterioferritin (cytochrome b1)